VAEVAPGQSWAGEQEHQEVSEQAGPAGVNHFVTTNVQVGGPRPYPKPDRPQWRS
jgi:hypothetical protein